MTWAVLGCQPPDPIGEYVVAKPPVRGSLWFFKVLGPEPAVDAAAGGLKEFVASVTFDDKGLPQWKLPEGWSEQASNNPVRYKTIRLPGEPLIEIAVTQIGGRVPPSADEIAAQAAMLREQLGLPADAAGADVKTAAGEPLAIGPVAGRLFDYRGETARLGKSRLWAAMAAVPIAPQGSARPAARTAEMPFTYERPAEWRDGRGTSMSVAAFEAGPKADSPEEPSQTVTITITPSGGDLLANVNRWRGQAGLPDLEQDQLEESLETLDVGDKTMLYAEASGEKRTIFGGILTVQEVSWFFKLDGHPATAAAERERFRTFLQSVRVRAE